MSDRRTRSISLRSAMAWARTARRTSLLRTSSSSASWSSASRPAGESRTVTDSRRTGERGAPFRGPGMCKTLGPVGQVVQDTMEAAR